MRILGIDPGSAATGYGIVEFRGGSLVYVAHGVLRAPSGKPLASRLAEIHAGVTELAARFAPDVAAVEQVFLAVNPRSALVLGQARGAVLAALAAAQVEVSELAAREVKKAVTGNGAAGKSQVQAMVMRLLELEARPQSDAADALAVAICQAHAGRLLGIGVRRRRGRRPRLTEQELLARSPR